MFMSGDMFVLSQLVNSMEEAVHKLENAKNKNDFDEFGKIKNFILDIQKKINEEILKG